MENLGQNLENQETLYISDTCDNEKSELQLNKCANILKILGFVIGGILALSGLILLIADKYSGPSGFFLILYAVLIVFLIFVYVLMLKVISNISMSLKDITKLLNR